MSARIRVMGDLFENSDCKHRMGVTNGVNVLK